MKFYSPPTPNSLVASSCRFYELLGDALPHLVPPQVEAIAERSKEFADNKPQLNRAASEAIATFRANVQAGADIAQEKDLLKMALLEEKVQAPLSRAYVSEWEKIFGGLNDSVALCGDDVVSELKRLSESTWLEFCHGLDALEGVEKEKDIIGSSELSDAYRKVESSFNYFAHLRRIRVALQRTPGYGVKGTPEWMCIQLEQPERKPPASDDLELWRSYRLSLTGNWWMPTRDELQALIDELNGRKS